jgi:site-specific DNA-methyltransferase (cytosine-N4-specific)
VFDPFAGSGTTLRVALEMSRSAVGIELHPEYSAYIIEQLEQI